MKTIFVVDDSNVNLMAAADVLTPSYRVFTFPGARAMFELLEDITPDLVLLDIMMPGMDGFETIRRLKADERHSGIPVIFLTSRSDAETEADGLAAGALDFISKPFSRAVLLNRIRIHLEIEDIVQERTKRIQMLKNGIVTIVADLVENRDKTTGQHIERTGGYIRMLLEAMLAGKVYSDEIRAWNFEMVISSARLHDVGKIAIPDYILNKPGSLTPEEFEIIKTHTAWGIRIIDNIQAISVDDSFLHHARMFAGHHHERWNGTGYPHGTKEADIPLQGRVMALVDVYDALMANRPYKTALRHEEAVDIIRQNRGKHFDPLITDVFLDIQHQFAPSGNGPPMARL